MDEHLVTVRITGGASRRRTRDRPPATVRGGRPMEFDEQRHGSRPSNTRSARRALKSSTACESLPSGARLDIDAIEATVVAYLEHALAYSKSSVKACRP